MPTVRAVPSAFSSTAWKTIAALRALTASAAAMPSTSSAAESVARLRSSVSMPASVSTGNSRKPMSAKDGIGGSLSSHRTTV